MNVSQVKKRVAGFMQGREVNAYDPFKIIQPTTGSKVIVTYDYYAALRIRLVMGTFIV